MAKGRITEYQQGGFSKQAVGTPGVDRSGAIIGEGIESLGGAIAKYEEKSDAISAQGKFNDFRFKYENKKAELQKLHRNTPDKFPEAMATAKQEIIDGMSKTMSGGELKNFKQYEMNFAGQEIDSIVGWRVGREKEILVDKAKGNFFDVEYASESAATPEDLKALLGDPNNVVDGELSVEGAAKHASDILDPGAIKELRGRTIKSVIDNHLSSRIQVDAAKTYLDLRDSTDGKMYDGIIENKNLLRHYMASAEVAMYDQGYREQFKNYATATVELAQMGEQVRNGEITVGTINRKIQWAELHKNDIDVNGNKMVTENYLQGLYAHRDRAMGVRKKSPKEISAAQKLEAEKFDTRWNNYLMGLGAEREPAPKDWDDVIGLYADLETLSLDGAISPEDYENKKQMLNIKTTNNLDPRGKSASLNEALKKAGDYGFNDWFGNPRDLYSTGYNIIDDHFKKQRPDLSVADRAKYREQALIEYTRTVNSYPIEQRNPKDKEQVARKLLYGSPAEKHVGIFDRLGVYKNPNTGETFMRGQTFRHNNADYVFLGVNPKNGQWLYETPEDFKKNAGK